MARPRKKKTDTEFFFDERAADHAVRFFERFLKHTKGIHYGRPFKLLDWQKENIIRPLFGWKKNVEKMDADGERRLVTVRKYRTAFIEIPKKNGKTTLSAGIGLYMTCADKEGGAEVYCCAADRQQAGILFQTALDMVKLDATLSKNLEQFRNQINHPDSSSRFYVLSSAPDTKHGFNPSCVIFDELHAQPNRDLWDTLTMGVGARLQPLVVAITTAGFDKQSICYQQYDYAKKIKAGLVKDDTFFSFIAEAEEDEPWDDPKTWRKANPSLGITVEESFLAEECAKAKEQPAYENIFRRLFLDQWTKQETRWIPMDKWVACGGPVNWAEYRGKVCFGGLDLASTNDLAALVLSFPIGDTDECALLAKFWIPENNIEKRVRQHRVPYDVWVREGFIHATPGDVIDYALIEADIEALAELYQIREIAYDPYNAAQLVQNMTTKGYQMVEFRQRMGWLSPPTKELEKRVVGKRVRHGDNPVLSWMVDNVAVISDKDGNIRPVKDKSREKIDGVVAAIMAVDRELRNRNLQNVESPYEKDGILFL